MKRSFPWHVVLPPAALLFQAAPPFLIASLSEATYGRDPAIPEGHSLLWTYLLLGGAAGIGFTLAGLGAYFLLSRARARWMVPAMVLFCVPALAASAVYARALVIFLGMG